MVALYSVLVEFRVPVRSLSNIVRALAQLTFVKRRGGGGRGRGHEQMRRGNQSAVSGESESVGRTGGGRDGRREAGRPTERPFIFPNQPTHPPLYLTLGWS